GKEQASVPTRNSNVASLTPSPLHPLTPSRRTAKDDVTGKTLSLKDAQRLELPNGMVLLLIEDRRLPIVVAQASLRHAALLEPEDKAGVAMLTGNLLDEGTSKHTGPQIAEMIEDVGGTLNVNASGGGV